MSSDRPGYELPLLLAGAFRQLIDDLHVELGRLGHGDAKPIHGFVLQAIGAQGVSISELGRRLGVSKQAAGKTATALEAAGYVARTFDPGDGRAWTLVRTNRGDELLAKSAAIFDRLRSDWIDEIGISRLRAIEDDLAILISRRGEVRIGDLPGWLR